MQTLSSKDTYTDALILKQLTSKVWNNDPVLFQESRMTLSSDRERIVLIRYIEHYSPGSGQWVEYAYSVPVCEFTQWIMANGELKIEDSEGRPGV